ncbi:hypothetical protein [Streptomyces massasporeus]|uniref:hypothetical protein n=1 Tax=Streptomyces massasporeus TaxID=67324 RepID=UPI00332086FF
MARAVVKVVSASCCNGIETLRERRASREATSRSFGANHMGGPSLDRALPARTRSSLSTNAAAPHFSRAVCRLPHAACRLPPGRLSPVAEAQAQMLER